MFATVGSNFKVPVVDHLQNPIVDKGKVHAGVWAICSLNAYTSGKGTPNHGPRLGLQSVMIVADDTNLGGAGADPRTQFKGVNVKPPAVAPSAAFGQPQAQPAPVAAMPSGSYGPPPFTPNGADDDVSQFL
jgi:hypothetical protein